MFDGIVGRRNDALQVLEELKALSRTSHIAPSLFSLVYMGIGDIEATKKYLQLGIDERDPLALFHLVNPVIDFYPLESFAEELRRKVGLPVKGL